MRCIHALSASLVVLVARAALEAQIPVGPEFQVNTYTTNAQIYPALSSDASGNFVVVWVSYDQDGDYTGVFARQFDSAGAALGLEFQVNSTSYDDQYFPAVASNAAGDFVVVWQSYGQDLDDFGVFGQRFDANANLIDPEFQVNTQVDDYQGRPAVAVNDDTSFMVVWTSYGQDGDSTGVFGQHFDSVGIRSAPEFQVNTYATDYQSTPAIAAGGENIVVVWTGYGEQDGEGAGIFGQRFGRDGERRGEEFAVNSETQRDQTLPDVAVDPRGSFVVVWQSERLTPSLADIQAQRFDSSGNRIGTEFQVNTYTFDDQTTPAVAVDNAGNFVVAWSSPGQDGDDTGIFARRFASNGAPLTADFQVNRYTTGAQTSPSVAAAADGRFVVVWSSSEQDGDQDGIFGQRFEARDQPPCVADCNADATVSVDEIVRAVNALLAADTALCPDADDDGGGSVTVDEVVRAIRSAQLGCA